jgi:hypothetical protein
MSNLYIQQLPSSFASIGEKHNALVDVIRAMSGAGGISVKVSDANVIIDGSGISVTGGGGTEGAPIQVVGATGLLNTVPSTQRGRRRRRTLRSLSQSMEP